MAKIPIAVKEHNCVYTSYATMLQLIHKAWSKYFDQTFSNSITDWERQYVKNIPNIRCPTPLLEAHHLRQVLATANAHATAGPDNWYTADLRELPDPALQQLAEIFNRVEKLGSFPSSMLRSWTSMIPKSPEPQPPTSLRPIAVLSALYRLYASARQATLSSWFAEVCPEEILSYLPGRSTTDAALYISTRVETIRQNREKGSFEELHILSLDASKAFPSVDRRQLWSVLQAAGLPVWLSQLIEGAYEQATTRFRVEGKYVHTEEHTLKAGINQGCPLSTMAFNAVQIPLVQLVAQHHPNARLVIYADDISIITTTKEELECTLKTVITYLDSVHVTLNKKKTQYWHIANEINRILVDEEVITARSTIKILGHTFREELATAAPAARQQTEIMKNELQTLATIPLACASRQMATMCILTPRWHYSSWHYLQNWKQEAQVRAKLVAAFFPDLAAGPRSAPMAILLFTRMHRCDPFAAKFWCLFKMLAKHNIDIIDSIQIAFEQQTVPLTPMAAFADMLMQMGGWLAGALYMDGVNPPLPITQPYEITEYDKWSHEWRVRRSVRLRLGYIRRLVDHRREFRPLLHMNVDYAKTLSWYRALEQGRTRSLLRIIMTGGMHTGDRAQRHRLEDPLRALCKKYPDTEEHRFWTCEHFGDERAPILHLRPTHPTTAITGIYTKGDHTAVDDVLKVQQFMVLVASRHADHHRARHDADHSEAQEDKEVTQGRVDPDMPTSTLPPTALQGAGTVFWGVVGLLGFKGQC